MESYLILWNFIFGTRSHLLSDRNVRKKFSYQIKNFDSKLRVSERAECDAYKKSGRMDNLDSNFKLHVDFIHNENSLPDECVTGPFFFLPKHFESISTYKTATTVFERKPNEGRKHLFFYGIKGFTII